MAELNMIVLDPESGRVVKTSMEIAAEKLEAINLDDFAKYPEIKKWMDDCEGRVKPETQKGYFLTVKQIFKMVPMNPKFVVASRSNAIEYWKSVTREVNRRTGRRQPDQRMRVAFKNLLDSHEISFGHKLGKKYNLGSEHDSYKKFAGVNIAKYLPRLFDHIKESGDLETFVWMKIGLKTSARAGAIATMTWERIFFDFKDADGADSFKIEIHETKVAKNHYHLGEDGNWFTYYPNHELKELLQQWRAKNPNWRFVWFPDGGSDVANRKAANRKQIEVTRKLARYYEIIKPELDPLTKEYLEKRPNHIMCHNFAQMCKDSGMSDEEIAQVGHWTDSQTISWYSATGDEKKKELIKKVRATVG